VKNRGEVGLGKLTFIKILLQTTQRMRTISRGKKGMGEIGMKVSLAY